MTELEKRILDAADLYNSLMRTVPREEVTHYVRERISRIQRDIARHWLLLKPHPISDDAKMSLAAPNEFTEFDALPLDEKLLTSRCIKAGDACVALFEQLSATSLAFDNAFNQRIASCK